MNLLRLTTWVAIALLALLCLNACKDNFEETLPPIPTTNAIPDSSGIFNLLEAYPDQTGILKEATLYGQPITYREINGDAVFQGDIILSADQLAAPTDSVSRPNGRTSGAGLADKLKRWRSFTIPYTIDPNLTNQARVTSAIAHWEAKSPLRFVLRTNQPDYITFRPGSGCSSQLGRIGGQQFINLATSCTTGSVIHEIGHAVGLMHEQNRTNRNSHIIVKTANIKSSYQDQYIRYVDEGISGFDFGTFDFNSIMLYPPYNSSAIDPTKPTMTRTDGTTWTAQTTQLSQTDIATVVSMYANLYIVKNGNLHAVALSEGWGMTISKNLNGFMAKTMAGDERYLWAIEGDNLWRIDRLTGKLISYGSGWNGAVGVTGIVGGNTRWAIQGKDLYAINKEGQRKDVDNFDWSGSRAIYAHRDFLFIVDGKGTLWKLDMTTGKWHNIGGGWGATKAIAAANANAEFIYILAGNKLWRVDGAGKYTQVGLAHWDGAEGMVGIDGKLYIVADDYLWAVDSSTGNRKALINGWGGIQSMGIIRNPGLL